MKIIVNGTNIFIDMNSIGLLGLMCELEYEIHTVDFVAAEIINPEQKEVFNQMVANSVISSIDAATKPEELMALNSRLPQAAIRERIDKWRGR